MPRIEHRQAGQYSHVAFRPGKGLASVAIPSHFARTCLQMMWCMTN